MVPHISRGPTVEDVARRAGVSRATAGRALSGADRVRPETREAVLRAADEVGYVVHASARALAAGRGTRVLIASVTPHGVTALPPCPYMDRVVSTSAQLLSPYGMSVSLRALPLDDGRVLDQFARDRDLAGVVLVNAHARLVEQVSQRMPGRAVSIGAGSPGVPLVDVDNRHSTAALAAHLLRAGRRRIVFVSGPTRISCTARGREGYAGVMTAAGLPVRIVPAAFTHAGGRAATDFALRRWPDIDAVIANCDDAAMGVIESLSQHGRRVPDDVAVTRLRRSPAGAVRRAHVGHPPGRGHRERGGAPAARRERRGRGVVRGRAGAAPYRLRRLSPDPAQPWGGQRQKG